MLIDYHAHVNFSAFKGDVEEVIKRAIDGGVFMILVGTQIDTSRRAVEMAEQYEKGVWASIGLHPVHLEETHIDESEEGVSSRFKSRAEVFDPAAYRMLSQSGKVVAIGECGLDYFHLPNKPYTSRHSERSRSAVKNPVHDSTGSFAAAQDDNVVTDVKSHQHATLRQHLDLADELDLPLILHCRGSIQDPTDAYRDQLAILREYMEAGKLKRGGAIHCFISTWEIAQQYLALGFHLGFTGVITFPKTEQYAEVVRNTPLDRILVETDCPYLAPVPMRGKRNEPLYVRYVAEKVAEVKGMHKEEAEKQLFENTLNVFHKINQHISHSERSAAK